MIKTQRHMEQEFIRIRDQVGERIKRSTPLDALEIGNRTYNTLRRVGVNTVGDFLDLDPERIPHIRNFGAQSLEDMLENGIKPLAEANDWERRAVQAEANVQMLMNTLEYALTHYVAWSQDRGSSADCWEVFYGIRYDKVSDPHRGDYPHERRSE